MADFQVKLGDLIFQGFEIPEDIQSALEQSLTIHQFPGGARVIDAMGRQYAPISWNGRFRGQDAESRYRALEAMAADGLERTLSWSEFNYSVVVRSVNRVFQRKYEILYQITVEVVTDNANTLPPSSGPSLDDMIGIDLVSASDVAELIDDSGINDAIAAVQSAVDQVDSFITATTTEVNSVLAPIAAAQQKVSDLISSTEGVIANVSTLGGVVAGAPITANVAALEGQVSAMTDVANLYGLNSILGRMSKNLTSKQQSGKQLTLAGGDLYQVAAQQYGDVTAWTGIAKANDLTDPQISGIETITIPDASDGADGVWTP